MNRDHADSADRRAPRDEDAADDPAILLGDGGLETRCVQHHAQQAAGDPGIREVRWEAMP